MTIIYIRHGKDRKGSHKHDEKLTKEGKKEVEIFTEKLVREYGIPDIIYYSPFHRTRHTAKYMLRKIIDIREDDTKTVKLKLDVNLGRFFTKRQKKNPDVRDSTYKKGIIVEERWEDFKERVESQLDANLKNNKDKLVWNITHSLVILQVAKLKNIQRDSHVEYLDTVVIYE